MATTPEIGTLRVASVNICRAFLAKETHIIDLTEKGQFDILVLQETDVEDVDTKNPPQIKNYNTICPAKTDNKTRILMLIKEGIKYSVRNDLMCKEISSIWVELRAEADRKTIIGSVYREFDDLSSEENRKSMPEQNKRWDIFLNQVAKASEERGTILCLGDFNLDSNKWSEKNYERAVMSKNLLHLIETQNMSLVSFGNTFMRCDKNGQIKTSAIDHAFYRSTSARKPAHRKMPCGFSDHDAIIVDIPIHKKDKKEKKTVVTRDLRKIRQNPSQYQLKLSQISWERLANFEDIDDCVDFWTREVKKVLDEVAPKREKVIKDKPGNILSKETLEELRKRDEMKAKITKTSSMQVIKQFRKQRNLCTRLVKKEKMNWFNNRLREQGQQEVWKIANEITKPRKKEEKIKVKVDDILTDNEMEVANGMNNFFITKVQKLSDGIDKTKAIPPTQKMHEHKRGKQITKKLVLKTVQEGKTKKIIQELAKKTSCGKDEMTPELLKLAGDSLIVPLTYIINKSIVDKKYPKQWKEAIVKPLYKNKGEKQEMKNYRPVALLCVPGMVLERVVTEQIENFLEENQLLGSFQFGFRRSRGTSTAVATTWCKANEADTNQEVIGQTYFDLSAAFDTVKGQTVCDKMRYLGIHDTTIKWVESYLSERSQQVKVGGQTSSPIKIPLGTPQGSRISPLLFNILACDLDLYLTNGLVCNFADDTSNVVTDKSLERVIQKLETDSENMIQFTSSNNLCLNPDKTAFIINKKEQHEMLVGGNKIKSVDSSVLLGMRIAGRLKWDSHVEEMKSILRKRLGLLRRLSYSLPSYALKQIAEGIFSSKLRYGIALYCKPKILNSDKSNRTLTSLTVLQNDMLRVILRCKDRRQMSVEKLRDCTKIMTVNQLCCYHILVETYSIITNKSSNFIYKRWNDMPGTQERERREEQIDTLTVPVNQGDKNGFLYYGARLWNLLPSNLRKLKKGVELNSQIARSMSEKEQKMALQRKIRRNADVFKKSVKKWIREHIPAD